jgi:hypothetical protein
MQSEPTREKESNPRMLFDLARLRHHDCQIRRAHRRCVGYGGKIVYDTSRGDGMPRKRLDSSRMTAMGWSTITPQAEGLKLYYDWFLANPGSLPESAIEGSPYLIDNIGKYLLIGGGPGTIPPDASATN